LSNSSHKKTSSVTSPWKHQATHKCVYRQDCLKILEEGVATPTLQFWSQTTKIFVCLVLCLALPLLWWNLVSAWCYVPVYTVTSHHSYSRTGVVCDTTEWSVLFSCFLLFSGVVYEVMMANQMFDMCVVYMYTHTHTHLLTHTHTLQIFKNSVRLLWFGQYSPSSIKAVGWMTGNWLFCFQWCGFFSACSNQTGSGLHPTSCLMCTDSLFSVIKHSEHDNNHRPSSVSKC
jgi:hypothetical protein